MATALIAKPKTTEIVVVFPAPLGLKGHKSRPVLIRRNKVKKNHFAPIHWDHLTGSRLNPGLGVVSAPIVRSAKKVQFSKIQLQIASISYFPLLQ